MLSYRPATIYTFIKISRISVPGYREELFYFRGPSIYCLAPSLYIVPGPLLVWAYNKQGYNWEVSIMSSITYSALSFMPSPTGVDAVSCNSPSL